MRYVRSRTKDEPRCNKYIPIEILDKLKSKLDLEEFLQRNGSREDDTDNKSEEKERENVGT